MGQRPVTPHRRALICAGERHVGRLLKVNLERQGFHVNEASSRAEALSLLESQPIDIVLLDAGNSKVDAYELLQWIRSHPLGETAKVIVINLSPKDRDAWAQRPYKADQYLVKPDHSHGIIKRIAMSNRSLDLSGEWVGYYVQDFTLNPVAASDEPSDRFAIRVTFTQIQGRLTGSMVDIDSEHIFDIRRCLDERTTLTGTEKFSLQRSLEVFPSGLQYSTMPSASDLQGRLRGRRVEFWKRYRGEAQYRMSLANGREFSTSGSLNPVLYRGELSENGDSIEGFWSIYARPFYRYFSEPTEKGSFRLTRNSGQGTGTGVIVGQAFADPT